MMALITNTPVPPNCAPLTVSGAGAASLLAARDRSGDDAPAAMAGVVINPIDTMAVSTLFNTTFILP